MRLVQIEQFQGVSDQTFLNLMIKRSINLETRHLIDLQQVWSQVSFLVFNQDIKPQNLEAHLAFNIVRLARLEQMINLRLHGCECLDDDVVYFLLQLLLGFFSELRNDGIHHTGDASFASLVELRGLVNDEILVVFVDRIVGQMHVQVIHVTIVWLLKGNGSESCQTFFVDVDSQRIHTGQIDIDPEIKLHSVNKVGLYYVSLDDTPLYRLELGEVFHQEDSSSLSLVFWLHNVRSPRLRFIVLH
jgi:hypothetical protein